LAGIGSSEIIFLCDFVFRFHSFALFLCSLFVFHHFPLLLHHTPFHLSINIFFVINHPRIMITQILAGVMAGAVRDKFGPVAPFDLSLILLVIGTVVILFTWEENYGDRTSNVGSTMWNAMGRLQNGT
jgi:hypothetical protein